MSFSRRVRSRTTSSTNSMNSFLTEHKFNPNQSHIRQLRIISATSLDALSIQASSASTTTDIIYEGNQKKPFYLQYANLLKSFPPELSAVVTLINAHTLRTYITGYVRIEVSQQEILDASVKLVGTDLTVVNMKNEDEIKYFSITDSIIKLNREKALVEIFLRNLTGTIIDIYCEDAGEAYKWVLALQLSRYEYTRLMQSYSAVLLSARGSKLSDIHVLLSTKKRPHYDWHNIRFPHLSDQWLKCFVCFIPSELKKQKTGSIEIYSSDKMTKRTLIAYIPKVDMVYSIFPGSPEMIDLNSLMKLHGEMYINTSFESTLQAQVDDDSYLTTPHLPLQQQGFSFRHLSPFNGRLRSNSAASGKNISLQSLSVSTPVTFSTSPSGRKPKLSPLEIPKSPISPMPASPVEKGTTSVLAYVSKNSDQFKSCDFLYLMPVTHPGVDGLETMLRNFIPITNVFHLYGRPKLFVSNKKDPQSLLFGLPSLPHYQFLSLEEALKVVQECYSVLPLETINDWNEVYWQDQIDLVLIKHYSSDKSPYTGKGDINRLYARYTAHAKAAFSPNQAHHSRDRSVGSVSNKEELVNPIDEFSFQSPRIFEGRDAVAVDTITSSDNMLDLRSFGSTSPQPGTPDRTLGIPSLVIRSLESSLLGPPISLKD